MFCNLEAEKARFRKNNEDIAQAINADVRTVRNKMNGKTEWKMNEMLLIKKMFPDCTLDYLFEQNRTNS